MQSFVDTLEPNYLNFVMADLLLNNIYYRVTPPWQETHLDFYYSSIEWVNYNTAASQIVSEATKSYLLVNDYIKLLVNPVINRFTITDTESATYMFVEPSELRNFYSFDDEAVVIPFLIKHSDLISFLVEAGNKIQDIFGQVQIKLRLIYDPEISDEPKLWGEIYTELTVDDALAKLNEFDETWFFSNALKSQGKVQFDVEWF